MPKFMREKAWRDVRCGRERWFLKKGCFAGESGHTKGLELGTKLYFYGVWTKWIFENNGEDRRMCTKGDKESIIICCRQRKADGWPYLHLLIFKKLKLPIKSSILWKLFMGSKSIRAIPSLFSPLFTFQSLSGGSPSIHYIHAITVMG